MKFLKKASALSLLPLLAACASTWDVESAKDAPNNGTAFQKALQSEYARLAVLERDESDWTDARLFAGKAIDSTTSVVAPQMVDERKLPSNMVSVATNNRNTLLSGFDKGGREKAPDAAARAQAGYDCWMQEVEENIQPEDIEACKKYFEAGLRDMFAALEEKPMAEKPMAKPMMDNVIVYFDFNSSELNGEGMKMAEKAAMMGKDSAAILVNGHTDTMGDPAYNEALALDRATAVADFLKSKGISARTIRVGASGENLNAVDTGDEVMESRNRRVEIMFK